MSRFRDLIADHAFAAAADAITIARGAEYGRVQPFMKAERINLVRAREMIRLVDEAAPPAARLRLLCELLAFVHDRPRLREVAGAAPQEALTPHVLYRWAIAEVELGEPARALGLLDRALACASAHGSASAAPAAPAAGADLAPLLTAERRRVEALRDRVYWCAEAPALAHTPAPPLSRFALFVKTFERDAERFDYLVRSIDAHCTGFSEMVVVSDAGFRPARLPRSLPVRFFEETVPALDWPSNRRPGYWYQQALKMRWTRYSDCDAAAILDSDVVVVAPFTPADLLQGGAPLMARVRWDDPRMARAGVWKLSSHYIVGRPTLYKYMLKPVTTFTRTASAAFSAYCEATFGHEAGDMFLVDPHGIFMSEFEMFGSYVGEIDRHGYALVAPEAWTPPIRKYQSAAPLSDKARAEIEAALNPD